MTRTDGPFDILRLSVVPLDGESDLGDREHITVGQHPGISYLGGQVDPQIVTEGILRDLEGLMSDPDALDAERPLIGATVHAIRIRFDLPAHHHLAKSERRFDGQQ